MTFNRLVFFVFLCLLTAFPAYAGEKPLTVFYYHRPPYYASTPDGPGGFLLDRARKIFKAAEIDVQFQQRPPARIISYIRHAGVPVCSVGWFKTPERQDFARFSQPIYRNRPIVVLTLKTSLERFQAHETLRDVFSDRSLVLATVDSFSYGGHIDGLINNYAPVIHEISSDQTRLPKLIVNQRASYMLIAPEEVNTLLSSAGLPRHWFATWLPADSPPGNIRYIMFSKSVSDILIHRVNQAIKALAITI